MNNDFKKGLLVGLVVAMAMSATANYVITKQEKTIERYKKSFEVMEKIAEELEAYVDRETTNEILEKYKFDSIVIQNFMK